MATPHPFRFGLNAHSAPDARRWTELARRAEALGYATLTVCDHVNPQLAPFPALTAAAAATTTLRVGTLVLANDLRHPVLTAKEIATVDLLSDGRFEWGQGTGWLPVDYEATGVPADRPGVRLARLAESVAVMRGLLSGEALDHDGEHYRGRGITGTPRPVQRPHPPLLIGGSQPRLLALAGREADIVHLSPWLRSRQFGAFPASLGVEEAMDQQVGTVRHAAGERADHLELALSVTVRWTERPADEATEVAPNAGLTPEEALRSPHLLLGTVDRICELLLARRERWGHSYVVIPAGQADRFAPVVARLAGR